MQRSLRDRGRGEMGDGWASIRKKYGGTFHVVALASLQPMAGGGGLGKHGITFVTLEVETLVIQAAVRVLGTIPGVRVRVLNKRLVGTTSFSGFTFSSDERRRGGTCRGVCVWFVGCVCLPLLCVLSLFVLCVAWKRRSGEGVCVVCGEGW